jgi:hypothetical protein
MRIVQISACAVLVTIMPLRASAGDFDGSKPLLCASVDVMECAPDSGCTRVNAEAINAPQFFKVNVADKVITGKHAGGSEVDSAIERSETVDGKLILQGAEDGIEGVRDGLGWSMAISQDNGNMVLSASGDAAAFVIFGACTPL